MYANWKLSGLDHSRDRSESIIHLKTDALNESYVSVKQFWQIQMTINGKFSTYHCIRYLHVNVLHIKLLLCLFPFPFLTRDGFVGPVSW